MLTNMENSGHSVGDGGAIVSLSKAALTTPFSINDILTRNNSSLNAAQQQQLRRRLSDTEMTFNAAAAAAEIRPNQARELKDGLKTSASCCHIGAGEFNSNKLNAALKNSTSCNSSNNPNPICEMRTAVAKYSAPMVAARGTGRAQDCTSENADFMPYYMATLENNSQSDYQLARKFGYIGTGGLVGGRDCPIDMRRCSNNESGNLAKSFKSILMTAMH